MPSTKVAVLVERTTIEYFLDSVPDRAVLNPEQLELYHAMKEAVDA